MSKVTVAVECSKETLELGQGLADFLAALKVALADGWQKLWANLPRTKRHFSTQPWLPDLRFSV